MECITVTYKDCGKKGYRERINIIEHLAFTIMAHKSACSSTECIAGEWAQVVSQTQISLNRCEHVCPKFGPQANCSPPTNLRRPAACLWKHVSCGQPPGIESNKLTLKFFWSPSNGSTSLQPVARAENIRACKDLSAISKEREKLGL